ncbi:MAG: hypothetical protein MJ041_05440 [Acidaminococcaceae bacterium]|nr:hypothetical protein [Acidaminococcaceae bacterium]
MAGDLLNRIETILGRELGQEEKERYLRVKEILQVSDNDAIWDLLVAMEYQRTFYEALPAQIRETAGQIVADLKQAAEKQLTSAQNSLSMPQIQPVKTWLVWGMGMVAILILYGSLTMWAGYCIGSGQSHAPALLLKMPVGVLVGIASLLAGLGLGAMAGKSYSEGTLNWRKQVVPPLCCLVFGLAICALTFGL